MTGIYKIISPSNKIYIGQSVNIEKRFKEYLKLRCPFQYKLLTSLNKYGADNHTFEIIEECDINLLNEKERYWQDYYEVLGEKGLNCKLTTSECKTGRLSEETKIKIGKGRSGKLHTEQTKMIMSQSRMGEKNHRFGKSLSDSHKLKISKKLLELKRDELNNKNSTILLDELTGIFYNSIDDLAKIYGINRSTIRDHLKGRTKNNKFKNFKLL